MEKGKIVRKVRDLLINRFSDASQIPEKMLKGKSLQRVFWAVVTLANMEAVKTAIGEATLS